MNSPSRSFAFCVGALVLGACSSPPGAVCEPACGASEVCSDGVCQPEFADAGGADAGAVDGGSGDARVESDAGAFDDAGLELDAATLDAGSIEDAGFDAGTFDDAGFELDASIRDASIDDARVDGGFDGSFVPIDAAASSCPEGLVLCHGACVGGVPPDVGSRTLATGAVGTSDVGLPAIAIDPCSGNVLTAYTRRVSSSNTEVEFVVVRLDGSVAGPFSITDAPGPASSVAATWSTDRFVVAWSDARHDDAPAFCTTCRSELYAAAFDAEGLELVGETRLTTTSAGDTAANVTLVGHPFDGETAIAWSDSLDGQAHVVLVDASLASLGAQVISSVVSPNVANDVRMVWDAGYVMLYRDDAPSASIADVIHLRTLAEDGTLGVDRRLSITGAPRAFAARDTASGFAVYRYDLPPVLDLLDATGGLLSTTSSVGAGSDGTAGVASLGVYTYVTDGRWVRRYDASGALVDHYVLMTAAYGRGVTLRAQGTRLVASWGESTSGTSSVHLQTIDVSAGGWL